MQNTAPNLEVKENRYSVIRNIVTDDIVKKVVDYCYSHKDLKIFYTELEELSGFTYSPDRAKEDYKIWQKLLLLVRNRLRFNYKLDLKADPFNVGREKEFRFYTMVQFNNEDNIIKKSNTKTKVNLSNITPIKINIDSDSIVLKDPKANQVLKEKDAQIKALQTDNEKLYNQVSELQNKLNELELKIELDNNTKTQYKAELDTLQETYESKLAKCKEMLKLAVNVFIED